MSREAQWAANVRFLDRLVARGDDVYLATNVYRAPATGFFRDELTYLFNKGYKIDEYGWVLRAPRN